MVFDDESNPRNFQEALGLVLDDMRETMIRKQHDYGPGNISDFGDYGVLVRVNATSTGRSRHHSACGTSDTSHSARTPTVSISRAATGGFSAATSKCCHGATRSMSSKARRAAVAHRPK